MVVICWVSKDKDTVLARTPLQASAADVRDWQELIDFMDKNGGQKEPHFLTLTFKCTLKQDKLNEEYMGLYTNGQMIMDLISGQIS